MFRLSRVQCVLVNIYKPEFYSVMGKKDNNGHRLIEDTKNEHTYTWLQPKQILRS